MTSLRDNEEHGLNLHMYKPKNAFSKFYFSKWFRSVFYDIVSWSNVEI